MADFNRMAGLLPDPAAWEMLNKIGPLLQGVDEPMADEPVAAPPRGAWDSIAMGLAAGLPYMPAARGAGANFAQGLARGFAMPRAAQVKQREEAAAADMERAKGERSEAAKLLRKYQLEARLKLLGMGPDAADPALEKQYDLRGVPKEFRTKEGVAAWEKDRARNDANLNRLQIRAAQVKDIAQFPEIRDAYNGIASFAESGTGVSDMALVFAFMKILDPTSVVREGEYERAVKTASIPEWLWAYTKKAATGAFLSPKQREEMTRMAGVKYNQKVQAYERARSWIDRNAKHMGLDPMLVIPDLKGPGVKFSVSQNEPSPDLPTDENGLLVPDGKMGGEGR